MSLSTGLVLELIRTSWQGEVGEDGEMVVRRHDRRKELDRTCCRIGYPYCCTSLTQGKKTKVLFYQGDSSGCLGTLDTVTAIVFL